MPPEMTDDDAKKFIQKFEGDNEVFLFHGATVLMVQKAFEAGVKDGIEFARES